MRNYRGTAGDRLQRSVALPTTTHTTDGVSGCQGMQITVVGKAIAHRRIKCPCAVHERLDDRIFGAIGQLLATGTCDVRLRG